MLLTRIEHETITVECAKWMTKIWLLLTRLSIGCVVLLLATCLAGILIRDTFGILGSEAHDRNFGYMSK